MRLQDTYQKNWRQLGERWLTEAQIWLYCAIERYSDDCFAEETCVCGENICQHFTNEEFADWLNIRNFFPFCLCVGCQMGIGGVGMNHNESALNLLLTIIGEETAFINANNGDLIALKHYPARNWITFTNDERN